MAEENLALLATQKVPDMSRHSGRWLIQSFFKPVVKIFISVALALLLFVTFYVYRPSHLSKVFSEFILDFQDFSQVMGPAISTQSPPFTKDSPIYTIVQSFDYTLNQYALF